MSVLRQALLEGLCKTRENLPFGQREATCSLELQNLQALNKLLWVPGQEPIGCLIEVYVIHIPYYLHLSTLSERVAYFGQYKLEWPSN